MGQILTMRTMARMETDTSCTIAFWVTLVLGALALALTVSGLFSVLSYLVEQRTKGDRRAHRARRDVARRDEAWCCRRPRDRSPFGLLAGAGLALALATLLIALPAAGAISEVVHVTDPLAYAASLLLIVAACLLAAAIPASRASRLDPMTTLRQE